MALTHDTEPTTLTLADPPPLRAELTAYAESRGESLGSTVRLAVRCLLDEEERERALLEAPSKRRKGTAGRSRRAK